MKPQSKVSAIGYCKPPEEHRFQAGVSGNPAGRPKKKPALSDAIERELSLSITLTENGKRETLTKAEVIAKQLTNSAMKGEFRFMRLLMETLEKKDRTDALRELSSPPESVAELRTPEQMKQRLAELLAKGGLVRKDISAQEPRQEILAPLNEEQ